MQKLLKPRAKIGDIVIVKKLILTAQYKISHARLSGNRWKYDGYHQFQVGMNELKTFVNTFSNNEICWNLTTNEQYETD